MERREFLRAGAIGSSGFAMLGVSSCAMLPKLAGLPGAGRLLPDMDAYLARMDGGLAEVARSSPSALRLGDRADPAADELARASLRTLYTTAMFADLPQEGQLHPGMQQRLWDAMPDMDRATSGMSDLLASQSPGDLARVQRALQSSRNPAMDMAAELDGHAARWGISDRRRLQTRLMVADANWRLRNQPPGLVVGETLGKVQRVLASDVSREAREDWFAGRVGEELFWAQQAPAAGGAQAKPPGTGPTKSTRKKRITRGAILMGLGAAALGLGIAMDPNAESGLIVVATVGAVLIVVGFIILLVGLAS